MTLDSCRFTTAVSARTPSLDSVGPLLRAESAGTYTLPAHVAMFNGFLPRPDDGVYPIDDIPYRAVWRSGSARPTTDLVAVPFTGRTVMDHYAARGWRTLGAGGVTFFDNTDPGNLLPSFFQEFHYFPNTGNGSPSGPRDRTAELALSHAHEIARRCLEFDRFFLFINCASTHIPYTTPTVRLTPGRRDVLERLYVLHREKAAATGPALTSDEISEMLDMQRSALEWADTQLGHVFDTLRDRAPLVVVCADHGEEFGEGGRYGHAHPHSTVAVVPLWCGLLR
ncbi:sulfatase-like hydrolase/transferase [Allokutzneria albata]|uniref:sulfatase-like hydrolase/transferase n=1 Tax=Allokutzneria albata TaxID=211114 RepID=UPI0018D466A3|nr:sulfatase-like hydrolase/transferase [Allokutzneria albata]